MADKTQRGQFASMGWLALMDFSAADSQGVAYDYTKPSLTPPVMFGAEHGWTQTVNGFWIPQTQLDADGKSTCGPVGGWLRVPPGTGSRTQPQWAPSQFLAQVQDPGPPIQVAVVQQSDGTLSTDLSVVFECTLLPGATAPVANDYGFLIQPARLDAQDPIFVPVKGGGASQIAFKIDDVTNAASAIYGGYQVDDWTGSAVGGGITSTLIKERTGSTAITLGQMVYAQRAPSGDSGGVEAYAFVLPLGVCS